LSENVGDLVFGAVGTSAPSSDGFTLTSTGWSSLFATGTSLTVSPHVTVNSFYAIADGSTYGINANLQNPVSWSVLRGRFGPGTVTGGGTDGGTGSTGSGLPPLLLVGCDCRTSGPSGPALLALCVVLLWRLAASARGR
jgi:hypothetical protein